MGKLKALIGILVIASMFYVAYKLIPPYLHKYELQDDLDEIARRNSYTSMNDDAVRGLVITKAQGLDINLKDEQVNITRTADGLGISVHYQIHVDLMVRPVDLDFTVESINKRI